MLLKKHLDLQRCLGGHCGLEMEDPVLETSPPSRSYRKSTSSVHRTLENPHSNAAGEFKTITKDYR